MMQDGVSKQGRSEFLGASRREIISFLLLSGSLLVGLSFAALLPPFEGFDEPQHYSYIEQIALTGTRPELSDAISAEVTDYLNAAPSALSLNGPWSYRAFFAAPLSIIARGRAAAHAPRDPTRRWRPAPGTANWQAQHPPLYYVLLAPAFRLSIGWSLDHQLILLRAISYVMAWLGLCMVTFFPATKPNSNRSLNSPEILALAPALWPALFPMWFVEMGRLGNDSVVAFWVACATVLAMRLSAKVSIPIFLALATVCALGLLTKATFLPLAAAIFLLLCYALWNARNRKSEFTQLASGTVIFVVVILAVSGWWYGHNLYRTGSLIGSNDEAHLGANANLLSLIWHKLHTVAHPILAFIVNPVIQMPITFVWAGTWSFVVPPLLSELPIALLLLFAGIGYLRRSFKTTLAPVDWVCLLTLVFFMAGLIREALIFFVQYGTASAPAWYIHSLAPLVAFPVMRGLAETRSWQRLKPFIIFLVVYPMIFLPAATAVLALYYSGCVDKHHGGMGFDFSSLKLCGSTPTVVHNLAALSEPKLAMALFFAGWILMLSGTLLAVRVWARSLCSPESNGTDRISHIRLVSPDHLL